jgi:hypothetical protein
MEQKFVFTLYGKDTESVQRVILNKFAANGRAVSGFFENVFWDGDPGGVGS